MKRRPRSHGGRYGAVAAVAALALAAAGCGSAAHVNSSSSGGGASFFKGKTLILVVPYSPGGGYDQWARLMAPYLKKYLDVGKVEVQNKPGSGGLIGTNAIYTAKPDGLTIGDTNAGGDVFNAMAGRSGVNFDVTKMTWIGRPDNDPHVIAVHPSGNYPDFASMVKSKSTIKSLATGKGSSDYNAAVITYNAFKVPFHMVAAFSGSKDEKAAFLRGDGQAISLSASDVAQMGGKAKVVVLAANQPFAQLPGVPTVIQEAQQLNLSSDTAAALTAMADVMDLGHAFIGPPGIPAARVTALRDAFQKALNDPQFQAAAKKGGLYLGLESGQDLTTAVADAMQHKDALKPLLQSH